MTTRSDLMERYWEEFLYFVQRFNNLIKEGGTGFGEYEKDASEINFWRWYIDAKLNDEPSLTPEQIREALDKTTGIPDVFRGQVNNQEEHS